jgi:DNA invertase Pin-like site-specific DNA recombinase
MDELRPLIEKMAAETAMPPVLYPANNRPKLTKRDVLLIRQMKRNGETQAAIAEVFDVNRSTVSRIIRGQYWR